MGPPPATFYVTQGSFPPAEAQIILAYIAEPSRYLGPMLMSGVIDDVLMGLVMAQTWSYYSHYSRENIRFRSLVGLLFATSLAQSATIAYMQFNNYGTQFGNWEVVVSYIGLIAFRMSDVIAVLQSLAGALSQIFFLERAVTLLRLKFRPAGWVLLALCVPFILAGLALGTASGAVGFVSSVRKSSFELIVTLVTAWKAVTIATDILLTGTILTCLYLNRTGRRSTDSLLGAHSRGVIEAQTLPLLAAVFFVICQAVDPGGNFACIPALMEGKLATLSVLHVLNSRTRLRDRSFVQSTRNLADFSANNKDGEPLSSGSGRTEKSDGSGEGRGRVEQAAMTNSVLHELDLEAFNRVVATFPSGREHRRERERSEDPLRDQSREEEEGEDEKRNVWDDERSSRKGSPSL